MTTHIFHENYLLKIKEIADVLQCDTRKVRELINLPFNALPHMDNNPYGKNRQYRVRYANLIAYSNGLGIAKKEARLKSEAVRVSKTVAQPMRCISERRPK